MKTIDENAEYILCMSQSTYDYLVELTNQTYATVLDEDDKEHKIPLDVAEDFPDGYVVLYDDDLNYIDAYKVDIPKATGGVH